MPRRLPYLDPEADIAELENGIPAPGQVEIVQVERVGIKDIEAGQGVA